MKAVEMLVESRFRHYVEVDSEQLATAIDRLSATTSDGSTSPGDAPESTWTSATVAAVVDTAERYERLRSGSGPLGVLRLPSIARALAGSTVSDLGATELDTMVRRLGRDAGSGAVRMAIVPTEQAGKRQVVSAIAAGVLMTRLLQAQPFGTVPVSTKRVAPESVTVTVLNGAGREGVAAQASRILKRVGYRVTTVGNANQFVYDKTLVIYDTKRPNAESVARDLGRGRVVASRGMYGFETQVLVIVGRDWPGIP